MRDACVLVLGGGGFAGPPLVRELRRRGARVATPGSRDLDVTDPSSVFDAVQGLRPATIVNLAAANPPAGAARMRDVNVRGAGNVARAAADCGARLVHVASDAGHDGRSSPYADDVPFAPLTVYGRSKAEGEARVLAACDDSVSVRTSLLFDPDEMDRGTRELARRLAAGEPCRVFTDEIRCPISRIVLAKALADLAVMTSVRGPLNVAGREALSRAELAGLLLDHFDVAGRERAVPVRVADLEAAGAPPRPRDVRLDVRRAEALLGHPLPGARETLSGRSG